MHYQIADLIVEVPKAGGMDARCSKYLCNKEVPSDIIIYDHLYRESAWPELDYNMVCYMESGIQFYVHLNKFQGIMLHSSAVELDGRAYLFSGPCGMGKSTHTKLWQQVFGPAAQVFNDDKPALRYIDGKWYAYGTPWCGKDGINQNKKVPLAGICFLKRGESNAIRQLESFEAFQKVMVQTLKRFKNPEVANLMLTNVENLVKSIPVFEMQNIPVPEAALLSHETMRKKAEEMGL